MDKLKKLKSAVNAEFLRDMQTLTLIDDDKPSEYQPVTSFAEYANRVYPFLEICNFHKVYYRLLQLFAEGRIRKLMVSMPPQHGKSVGASTLLPSYMLGLNPDMRIPLPPTLLRWPINLTAEFNELSRAENTARPFPIRGLSAAANLLSICVLPTRLRLLVTRVACCRWGVKARLRAIGLTALSSTTSTKMQWRPTLHLSVKIVGSGTPLLCVPECIMHRRR